MLSSGSRGLSHQPMKHVCSSIVVLFLFLSGCHCTTTSSTPAPTTSGSTSSFTNATSATSLTNATFFATSAPFNPSTSPTGVIPDTSNPAGTPGPNVGFAVLPNQVALEIKVGEGPGGLLLPPGAVTERTVIEVVTFDFNPRTDGEPDGEWRIASKVIKFMADQDLNAAIRIRILVENALTLAGRRLLAILNGATSLVAGSSRRVLGTQPYLHWKDHAKSRWEILCDTTYDADVPIVEANIDRSTINSAAFRGSDGARLAAFYRNEAICDPAPADADDDDGISGGRIAGIVCGILAGLVMLAGCVYCLTRRYQQPNYSNSRATEPVVGQSDIVTAVPEPAVKEPSPEPEPEPAVEQPPLPVPVMPYAMPFQGPYQGQYLMGSQPPMLFYDQQPFFTPR